MKILSGYKTYIIAGLMVLVGLVKVFTGDASAMVGLVENAQLIFDGMAFATVRAGIAKAVSK